MTCIVGLEYHGNVYMGCDSASVSGLNIRATGTKKLFKRYPFIIGYTTSFRMGQLLQYGAGYKLTTGKVYDEEFMVTEFIETIRECFKEYGYAEVENNIETGGNFLVGVQERIYEIDSDYQVNHYPDGMYAVGCGENYALASLYNTKADNPKARIESALETAAYFSNGVVKPFHFLNIEEDQPYERR